jgi:hypothetical protein
LKPKSDVVVDTLVQIVRTERGDTRRNAAWGLRTGVPPAARPRVAEAMLSILREATHDDIVTDCVDLVVAYGDVAQLDVLRSLAADLRQPEKKRQYIGFKLHLTTAGEGD